MIVGFTGSRKGMDEAQRNAVRALLIRLQVSEFHHGDCVGADVQAHVLALRLHIPVYIHPPLVRKLRAMARGFAHRGRPLPYFERNRAIVDACDVLIAAPKEEQEQLRSGTWGTVRYAIRTRREVYMAYPNRDECVIYTGCAATAAQPVVHASGE